MDCSEEPLLSAAAATQANEKANKAPESYELVEKPELTWLKLESEISQEKQIVCVSDFKTRCNIYPVSKIV